MTTHPAVPRRTSSLRARLLDSADHLFYVEGIRAVSADRIIADVGTSKATFYRHFPTKDALVVAYLERQAETDRAELSEAASPEDPVAALDAVVHLLASAHLAPTFRGCPFLNAAAEIPDPDHPARRVIADQRAWWRAFFADLAARLGVAETARGDVADQLVMLRDGALIAGYVDDPEHLEQTLGAAARATTGWAPDTSSRTAERGSHPH